MRLVELAVENFRGLRRARLELDRTAVLIGENGSGKSSLLDALALGLGAAGEPELRPADFHRPEGGSGKRAPEPVRIVYTLRETRADEWQGCGIPSLESARPRRAGGRPEVQLELLVRPSEPSGGTRWRIRDHAGRDLDPERATIQRVRRLCPVIQVRGGLVVPAVRAEPPGRELEPGPGDARAELERRVEQHYRRLVDSHAMVSPRELRAGFAAARQLLERAPERLLAGALRPDWLAGEFAARQRSRRGAGAPGSGARSVGLLLLLGALLEARADGVGDGAQPILVVEEPETHLHPLTLASVWALVESVRLQKVITTHSAELLAAVPLEALRRIARRGGSVGSWRLKRGALQRDERRKVRYHVRARRGGALFARCWLLIEGETEFWLLPELARRCGYDLEVEGVECVEFAQCGVAPLAKLAEQLGIEWHLLADGDHAGEGYARAAASLAGEGDARERITSLREPDLEHCLWRHGYQDVYLQASGQRSAKRRRPRSVIERAVRRRSKPFLAIAVLDAMRRSGSPGVPPPLRAAVDTAVRLARRGPRQRSAGRR